MTFKVLTMGSKLSLVNCKMQSMMDTRVSSQSRWERLTLILMEALLSTLINESCFDKISKIMREFIFQEDWWNSLIFADDFDKIQGVCQMNK